MRRPSSRGGFGIFVQPEGLGSLNSQGTNSSNAFSNSEGFSATDSFSATTNNYLTPAHTLSNPFPNGFATATGSAQGASTFLGQAISFLAPVQHDPYSERYNIGFQREITPSTLVEMLYVGNHKPASAHREPEPERNPGAVPRLWPLPESEPGHGLLADGG